MRKQLTDYHQAEVDWHREKERLEELPREMGRLEAQMERMKKRNEELEAKYEEKVQAFDVLKEENIHLVAARGSLETKSRDLSEKVTLLGQEQEELRAHYLDEKHAKELLQSRLEAAREELGQLKGKGKAPEGDLDPETAKSIRAQAVREYRQSKDCYNLKEQYGSCFSKYGFYLARSFLERETGISYPTLVWSDRVLDTPAVDWKVYNVEEPEIETYLAEGLEDTMENLEGPWSPMVRPMAMRTPARGDGGASPRMIAALEGILEGDDDLFDGIDLSPRANQVPEVSEAPLSPSFAAALASTQVSHPGNSPPTAPEASTSVPEDQPTSTPSRPITRSSSRS